MYKSVKEAIGMNPNNITNVSFASSPALHAILNSQGASAPITPVGAPKPITTESYLVQNPVMQQAAVESTLEKTPKTDVYEPMHNKDDKNPKSSKGAKIAAAAGIVSIGAIIAAVIFAPKVAKALLENVDAASEIKKGKEFFTTDNAKILIKKFANFVEKKEASLKDNEFIKSTVEKITSAFEKDGAIGKGITKVKDAFKDGGAVKEFLSGLSGKKGAAETAAEAAEALGEAVS